MASLPGLLAGLDPLPSDAGVGAWGLLLRQAWEQGCLAFTVLERPWRSGFR